jgi:hypothetical protein
MSAEFESYLETLGNVTEQECINNDVINDGRLPDDIGIEKVIAHNEKIRSRKKRDADKKPVGLDLSQAIDPLNMRDDDEILTGVSMANRIEPLLAINFEPLSQRKITYSVLISVDSFLLPA